MKNVMLTLFAVLFCVTVSLAQERGNRQERNPEERAKAEVERLKTELGLSKPQQDSILNYILQANQEQRKAMEQAGGDRQAAFEKMRAQRETRQTKIKSFLTKEQIEKYEVLQKERIGNRPQQQRQKNN
ncbi:MAG TPA: hypothetical protein PKA53_00505 [Sphingobacterium sp.]|nr:hypothetical protein [Sphingobacterium sp.]